MQHATTESDMLTCYGRITDAIWSDFEDLQDSDQDPVVIYPSQTKILEGWTKDEIWIFEALFKGVSTRYGLRAIEKSVENPDFIFCYTFQNLRLGSI